MASAAREDRLWFQSNPAAIIRFRSASDGEFTPLEATGVTPPSFRPSFCRANAPLRWVAVAAELLEQLESEQSPIAV